MTANILSPYTGEQLTVWLRGLLTIAWADGHLDAEEQKFIEELAKESIQWDNFAPITPQELGMVLGSDGRLAENFLRTAVMTALADGVYSPSEDALLHQFSVALGKPLKALDALHQALLEEPEPVASRAPLQSLREWLDQLEVHDPRLARWLCKVIPSQCPFERDVVLFRRKLAHIPPLCKLNPLFDQLVGLRFRALCYLADTGVDVTPYC
jgi:tellurite resistance protein